MRALPTIFLVGLLVVAGCMGGGGSGTTAAPTESTAPSPSTPGPGPGTTDGGDTPTRTTTRTTTLPPITTPKTDYTDIDNVSIVLDSGSQTDPPELGYDINRTWVRVLEMLGTNYEAPPRVLYIAGREGIGGSTSGIGSVYLTSTRESVLAHEYAHRVLLGVTPEPSTSSADETFAVDAVVEGSAEYIQQQYEKRYLGGSGGLGWRLPADPARAYFLSRYFYGYKYVKSQVDGPGEVVEVHRRPPKTGEHILHGLAPGTEPPARLGVEAAPKHFGSDATWGYAGLRTLGELSVYITLRTRIPQDRAWNAAHGWGNDQVLTFERSDGERGFAWVIRWDDRSNATEFLEAGRAYANGDPPLSEPATGANGGTTPYPEFTDDVWGPTDSSVTVRRVGPRTTAMVVGPSSFLNSVDFERNGSVVTVSVD